MRRASLMIVLAAVLVIGRPGFRGQDRYGGERGADDRVAASADRGDDFSRFGRERFAVVARGVRLSPGADEIPEVTDGSRLPQWATGEIRLRALSTHPDPFGVELEAVFEGPGGRTLVVPGFYDGDGMGGDDGNVWKVRFFLDRPGVWRYRTRGTGDPGLDGRSGRIIVTDPLPHETGPLERSPSRPWFRYRATGGYAYLQAKFLDQSWNWVAGPDALRFNNTHVYLSDDITDLVRAEILLAQHAYGNRRMNVYLANVGDYGGEKVLPWPGPDTAPDYMRFDLARMHRWDAWLRAVTDAGIYLHLWFLADDSKGVLGVPSPLTEEAFKRLIRYAVARWGGYGKVLWCLSLEYDENNPDPAVWNRLGEYLKEVDPYGHPRSIHGTSRFDYSQSSWHDHLIFQLGFGKGHEHVYRTILEWRGESRLPVFAEEFAKGTGSRSERQELWAAFTAGATAGTGSHVAHLNRFVGRTGFYRLDVRNDLRTGGGPAYVLAAPGEEYVVYLPEGGSVRLQIEVGDRELDVEWYDPGTGALISGGRIPVGGQLEFAPPRDPDNDWVLHIRGPSGRS
nr:MAG: hypothetical protein DIU52_00700 [bacterium]